MKNRDPNRGAPQAAAVRSWNDTGRCSLTCWLHPRRMLLRIGALCTSILPLTFTGATKILTSPSRESTVRKNNSLCPTGWNCLSRRRSCDAVKMTPPPPKQRIPFHMHIRKSGGSLMCAIAVHAHKDRFSNAREALAHGCNMLGDGPGNVQMGIAGFANRGWCCQDRYVYAQKHQRGFIAREIFSPMGPLCTNYFLYSIVMRDPIGRIQSQMTFSGHTWSDVEFWLTHPAFNMPPSSIVKSSPHTHRYLLKKKSWWAFISAIIQQYA